MRGKFIGHYTPEKTVNYENLVRVYAAEAMGENLPILGAVKMELLILVTPPTSWSNKKRIAALHYQIYPTTKPDLDNVLKAVCDACNGVIFDDDKQVVDCEVSKRYSEKSGAVISVRELCDR
jgi:Holliday junction resolvase RusA-like endonuclease